MIDLTGRHPGVVELAKHFEFEHLPDDLKVVSAVCHRTAADMLNRLPDSAELTVGLRKLLEAKDCFVRAAVAAR